MAMSRKWKWLLGIGAVLFVLLLVGIIGIALMVESFGAPSVEKNSVLVLNVSGSLPDHSPKNNVAELFGVQPTQSFTGLLTQLRKAKADSRIGAVLMDVRFPRIGWGKADELRAAVKDFRESGKPVFAYMDLGMNKEYYIAASADSIYMPPAGDIYINGLAANATFYRGSLDKLGIEPDVIAIGKYKSAPERFTRKDMSEEQREVTNAILDEFYNRLSGAIAESRKLTPDNVKELIDNAPYHGNEAKELGLIDGAMYRDEVYEELKKRLGYGAEEKIRTISSSKYSEISADSLGLNNGEKIAVIFATGAINLGRSNRSPFGGQTLGSTTLIKNVKSAADDASIKAIVLRIDSPGGSALASDLMWKAIENAKAKKPIVVSMSDVAASGGYYIACNANKIVAESTSITGSIGVFMGKPVMKGFYDWIGMSNEVIQRGENSGIFRDDVKWTEKERAKMQDQANKVYFTDFVPKVAAGRNMDVEKVNSLGQGHVWTGTQAKENGLIDEIGGLEKAIQIARELAELPSEKDVKRIAYPKSRSFYETYFGSNDETKIDGLSAEFVKDLPDGVKRAFRIAFMFDQMKRGDAMMMMPFELEIK